MKPGIDWTKACHGRHTSAVSRRTPTRRHPKKRKLDPDWLVNPVVCRAGEFQFAPLQSHANGCVQSRALFWCKSGHGIFKVNGQKYTLEPHDLYVLPWNREISYLAGEKEPMFTAHVHIVPWMRPGAFWVPNVPHERGESLFDSPDRSDVFWPGFDSVVHLHLQAESALGRLINYATQWFRESPRLETEARALGRLIVCELERHLQSGLQITEGRPPELTRMLVFVDRCLAESPTVDQLAAIISRSRSHVLKLFQRHLGLSAKTYIIDRQMREARELLLSTTLSISEVGRACGLPDPYHFSKLFRRNCGMPPRAFREIGGTIVSSTKPQSVTSG